jgi:hypothetical protein
VFLLQEAKPFIVEIIRPPTEETTVVDVLVGSLGLAGAFALAAVPLGLIVGVLLIRWNKRRRPESEHMPHISPSMQLDADRGASTDQPSSPAR